MWLLFFIPMMMLQLLGIMLSTFPPSEDLENFLEMFLREKRVRNKKCRNCSVILSLRGGGGAGTLYMGRASFQTCTCQEEDLIKKLHLIVYGAPVPGVPRLKQIEVELIETTSTLKPSFAHPHCAI